MFENIGNKIKALAKVIFITDAMVATIFGIVLVALDEEMIAIGLIIAVIGFLVAWVSSWFLYAFGELIEKTSDNESNTRQILKLLKEKGEKTPNLVDEKEQFNHFQKDNSVSIGKEVPKASCLEKTTFTTTEKNTIICSNCKTEQASGRKVCWECGAKFEAIAGDDNEKSF